MLGVERMVATNAVQAFHEEITALWDLPHLNRL